METKFRISEFAKMYGVSRPTLIYYDSINLLKPSLIVDNGYRLYTFGDMEKLELIFTLKESGLSLKGLLSLWFNLHYNQVLTYFFNKNLRSIKKLNLCNNSVLY